ncbi:DNA polymerase III subunit epsilon [Pacificibacter marinus]|uniref:DNA polymerase III subunit epsilon n=1 Tax=Pacificibacter marinus TaxID=658057 RepID=A0A1Y5SYK5_9RHOB|nr:DNA polymerase III subunit epsilon [Pacificibacter marinus]SEL03720.1 DNA polymerase-3 subunit epsilon [Pacificibacter marinus]SLN51957.1 DNA polymerase III subunit epsilon [Pacificibacter marinus]
MREIVLDTETTGFDPLTGDRLVEIGAIELDNHLATGRTYHQYINPRRTMPAGAFGVHGIGPDILEPPRPARADEVTLLDKPVFKDVAQAFLDFIGDSTLVIHNAAFDIKFLNAELKTAGLRQIPWEQALDTLAIARKKFPGSPATLDALCRRFHIDNSNRSLHGALLDSEILAEVYLELIGGRQPDLVLAPEPKDDAKANTIAQAQQWRPSRRPIALPSRLTDKEAADHAAFVEAMGDGALWSKLND